MVRFMLKFSIIYNYVGWVFGFVILICLIFERCEWFCCVFFVNVLFIIFMVCFIFIKLGF